MSNVKRSTILHLFAKKVLCLWLGEYVCVDVTILRGPQQADGGFERSLSIEIFENKEVSRKGKKRGRRKKKK